MKGEPDVLQEYQKRYDTAMLLLQDLAENKNLNDTFRSGQRRSAVV